MIKNSIKETNELDRHLGEIVVTGGKAAAVGSGATARRGTGGSRRRSPNHHLGQRHPHTARPQDSAAAAEGTTNTAQQCSAGRRKAAHHGAGQAARGVAARGRRSGAMWPCQAEAARRGRSGAAQVRHRVGKREDWGQIPVTDEDKDGRGFQKNGLRI